MEGRKGIIVSPEHKFYAAKYSARALELWTGHRDRTIVEIYQTYGVHVTQDLMGWTRPTIYNAKDRVLKVPFTNRYGHAPTPWTNMSREDLEAAKQEIQDEINALEGDK